MAEASEDASLAVVSQKGCGARAETACKDNHLFTRQHQHIGKRQLPALTVSTIPSSEQALMRLRQ